MRIYTQINIKATPETVWNILTDFQQYPLWNPFITQLKGSVAVGQSLHVRIQPPGGSAMKFSPIVTEYEEKRCFEWEGKLLIKGLFDGKHRFELTPLPDGSTLLEHSEVFSGVLVRWIDLSKTQEGFHLMNQQLKELAEKSAVSTSLTV